MDLDFELQTLDNIFDVGAIEYLDKHEIDNLELSDLDLAIPKSIVKPILRRQTKVLEHKIVVDSSTTPIITKTVTDSSDDLFATDSEDSNDEKSPMPWHNRKVARTQGGSDIVERNPSKLVLKWAKEDGVLEWFSQGRGLDTWLYALHEAPADFFGWKAIKSATEFFHCDFNTYYQANKTLFKRLVEEKNIDWTTFLWIVVTVTHFILLGGENYKPISDLVLRPFTFKTCPRKYATRRSVPLAEILVALSSNIRYKGYECLLYGIATWKGEPYLYDLSAKVPTTSTIKVHTDILFLALSFLIEVGVVDLDRGFYIGPLSAYDIEFDLHHTYAQKVSDFRSLEHLLNPELFHDQTFFFEVQQAFSGNAWYSLLAAVHADIGSYCTYNPLVDLYEHKDYVYYYDCDAPYFCPAVSMP